MEEEEQKGQQGCLARCPHRALVGPHQLHPDPRGAWFWLASPLLCDRGQGPAPSGPPVVLSVSSVKLQPLFSRKGEHWACARGCSPRASQVSPPPASLPPPVPTPSAPPTQLRLESTHFLPRNDACSPVGFTNNFKFYCFLSLMNSLKRVTSCPVMNVELRPARLWCSACLHQGAAELALAARGSQP